MTQISLYNTLSRNVEPIQANGDGNTVGFYCCGPTVYAHSHIGNFRTFIAQDVMRRALQVAGYKVVHVRNLTDIDDKTIARSSEEGEGLRPFTERWTERFHEDCERLNLLEPTIEPKATDHIDEQIAMIETLIEKGHAYASADGSVYFRVSSFDEYGKLSRVKERQLTTDNAETSPVDSDEYERDSLADFAMWKSRKESDGDVFWESPWGQGRPGWHIECSAMAVKYLGKRQLLDIHSGGGDLIFPHHENEIAQSECSCGQGFFRYWVHCAHLLVDGKKMSKSLHNFYTVDEIADKGFAPVVLRYALTSGHYRQTINLTMDSLHAAQSALWRLLAASDELMVQSELKRTALLKEIATDKHEAAAWGLFEDAWQALGQDLNISAALGRIFTELKRLKPKDLSSEEAAPIAIAFHKLIYVLGYDLDQVETESAKVEAPVEVERLAQERWEAKQAKDWARADELRAELQEKGWSVLDSKTGYELEKA